MLKGKFVVINLNTKRPQELFQLHECTLIHDYNAWAMGPHGPQWKDRVLNGKAKCPTAATVALLQPCSLQACHATASSMIWDPRHAVHLHLHGLSTVAPRQLRCFMVPSSTGRVMHWHRPQGLILMMLAMHDGSPSA